MAGTMDDFATSDLTPRAVPGFAERLATIADFLPASLRDRIVAEIEALGDTERSYLPLHKQGGTVAYETLRTDAPAAVALYQSAAMRNVIGRIVGLAVETTPLDRQELLLGAVLRQAGRSYRLAL